MTAIMFLSDVFRFNTSASELDQQTINQTSVHLAAV